MADTIYIVTADKIADTGSVSFKFLFDAELPEPMRSEVIQIPWGYVWVPDRRDPSYSYNVWRSGKFVVGGGWTKHDDEAWQRVVLSELPSCTLLMTTEVFEWLKVNILDKFGRAYQRHHVEKILATS